MRPFVSNDEELRADQSFRRERHWHYPAEALREAVLNAAAHRDWTRFREIEVVRYEDRLEVSSPGALPNSMTVDDMKAGQRLARNQIIVDVLRDYGYIEARGMGVRKKIIPLLRDQNGIEPDFVAEDKQLRVVMWRGPLDEAVAWNAEVNIRSERGPVAGVAVMCLFPNTTFKRGRTNTIGKASFRLYRTDLPMTVFAAAHGYAACIERDWIPADGPLEVDLRQLADGGSTVFWKGTGHVPGLAGRLNPIRDSLDRHYVYADNIAVNGARLSLFTFRQEKTCT